VILTGHYTLVKLSSKDDVLFPFLLDKLHQIEPRLQPRTVIAEQLKNFDAVIATGSNNSARYFEHYFGKYPHIIRKNRSSVAIIDKQTTMAQLELLADDVFTYFGLGCRNVSKLYIHHGVEVDNVITHFNKYKEALDHNKYRNNFDYRLTLMLMNSIPHHANGAIIAVEDKSISSPLAVVHYERYTTTEELNEKLASNAEQIQAIIGTQHIPFGSSQVPALADFADGVDVMTFLLSI
jgi:hypothetical protein